MAKGDTWMPFYVGDYLRDTGHLTTEEHGAYMLLLMHAWMRNGVLPNDDSRLRAICRLDARVWRRCRSTILEFFSVSEDGLRQKRLDQELAKTGRLLDQRSAAGKASAEARQRQREINERSTSVATEQPTEPPTEAPRKPPRNGRPSPSPIQRVFRGGGREREGVGERETQTGQNGLDLDHPTPAGQPAARPPPKARSQIPEDWLPGEADDEFACERIDPNTVGDTVTAFIAHHRANATTMADWGAAWRTWIIREVKFRERDNAQSRLQR